MITVTVRGIGSTILPINISFLWSRLCVIAFVSLILQGCNSDNGFETVQFDRTIPTHLIAKAPDSAQGNPGQFDLTEWFGNVPLGGEVPMLRVQERIDLVVVESTDENVYIDWMLPEEDDLYLRISDSMFEADSCPVGGTPADEGITALASLDGFSHPIRRVYQYPVPWTSLDVTSPQLDIGRRYYLQGCPVEGETGLFTGTATNVVVIDIATALPDLVISEIRLLGRSADTRGRPFILVRDEHAAIERETRGDSFDYQVRVATSDETPVSEMNGVAQLMRNGSAWIIPGMETPADPSDDIRVPDDGRNYLVSVHINNSVTGITIPEYSHLNNMDAEFLRARPKPLIFGIDRVYVNENCDGVSPGDWLLMLLLDFHGEERRIVANSTIDVNDDTTYMPKMGFRLSGTNVDSEVSARLGFVDCDFDLFSGFVLPVGGPIWSSGTVEESCGGEEAYEVGGLSDLVGWARVGLSGTTLESSVTRTVTASEENCGPTPFTVDFKLMTQEQAVTDGYDMDALIDIR